MSTAKQFDLPASFWARVDKRGPDQCWEWLAGKDECGYGLTHLANRSIRAHRAVLISIGHDLKGKIVMHRCDNPPCCNPRHLQPGTHRQNVQDCIAKGRFNKAKGEKNSLATLKESQVKAIRAAMAGAKRKNDGRVVDGFRLALANKYRVSIVTINNIASRRTWGHLP